VGAGNAENAPIWIVASKPKNVQARTDRQQTTPATRDAEKPLGDISEVWVFTQPWPKLNQNKGTRLAMMPAACKDNGKSLLGYGESAMWAAAIAVGWRADWQTACPTS